MPALRRVVALVLLTALAAACAPDAARAASTGSLVSIGAGLTGPHGTTASIYSYGPEQVSAFAFDTQDRLWLSTAASSDTGSDGVYVVAKAGSAPVEVLSGLHTPLGLLWYQDSLYVASKGGVLAYRGFDGRTFASHGPIVSLPTDVGEENGLVLAPDGRMWMGISAPCDSCTVTSPYSASIVSFRPDGTDVRIEVSAIRAAVGLAYVPHTSDLLVSVDQRDDLGAKTPGDWLARVRSGQSWGFPGCYGQRGSACTGVPSPVGVLDRHAGADGVAIVTGQLGSGVGTAALVAEWATGRVEQVSLTRRGSGYSGTVTTAVRGFKHPVPVIVSPDGAVLVGDWGTGIVYRLAKS